jgi:opacity protein-like surface antigen
MKKIEQSLLWGLILIITCPFLFSSTNPPASREIHVLNEIHFSREMDSFVVIIMCDPYSSLHQFELSEPNRLVIDLHGLENIQSVRQFQVQYSEIKTLRLGMFKSNIARVVFDFQGKIPDYKVSEIQEGIKVSFPDKETDSKQIETKPRPKKIQELEKTKAEDIKANQSTVKKKDIDHLEKKIQEQTRAITQTLQETQSLLDQTIAILQEMKEQQRLEEKKFIRIEALGSLVRFSDEKLRNDFQSGFMEGAEINIGIGNHVEFWMAFKNFTKIALDSEQGTDRKIKIIPLEAGLKLRFNKGLINPYLGGGIGYHQYHDIHLSEELKKRQIGFIGQAGFFLKAAENLVFDLYANYRYCQIDSESKEFNIGGIHYGAGFGFEF